jgi:iron complex transport system ATP-binding protein
MLDLVREMNREQQRGVIMILHDLDLAVRYCDYLIVLKDGQIVTAGTPKTVITPEMLPGVFEIEGTVMSDPVTGSPIVIPERSCTEEPVSSQ